MRKVDSAPMGILDDIRAKAARIAKAEATIKTTAAERDKLIAEAREGGHQWDAIADAAGMSRQNVTAAAKRGTGGHLPKPKPRN